MVNVKRSVAGVLMAALCISGLAMPGQAEAAKKPKLSKSKVTVKAGGKITVKVKKAAGAKITWKSKKKKIAKVTKSGKYAAKITGVKKGNTVVKATVKKGKKKWTLTCKVKVTKAGNGRKDPVVTDPTQAPVQTAQPGTPVAPQTSQPPVQTVQPTTTPNGQEGQTTPAPGEFVPVEYKKADFENSADGFSGRSGQEKVEVSDGGYSGKCLKVSGRKDNWHGAKLDVAGDIVKGATYKVSAWMKHMAGEPVEIKCSGQTGSTYPAIASVKDAPSGEWVKIEGTVEIPLSFSDYIIYFEIPGSKTADFYLDSVEITQISAAKEPVVLTSVKDTYKDIFQYMGVCANYNGWRVGKQLADETILGFIKQHFNSITLEDEMKPSSVLGNSVKKISLQEAENKGYVIPDNYPEDVVPQLNFDTLDKVLEICQKEGLKMRAHTLQWHQQMRPWFFAENYSGSTATTPEVMDARTVFYIKTVMKHVMDKEKELSGGNGTLIYAWDVTNEYIHRTNNPDDMSWMDVYGDMGLKPAYVKLAYQTAYGMLKEYGVQDSVHLFYNDYNTYHCADDIIELIEFINEGEPEKLCRGIGMQSHIDVGNPTVERYAETVDAFLETGLELQVTELDVGSANVTDEEQAAYVKEWMEMLIRKHMNRDKAVSPKGITGVTIWGLYDSASWKADARPLFLTSIYEAKPSFDALIEAAASWNQE